MKKQEIYDYIKSHKILTTEDDATAGVDAAVTAAGTSDLGDTGSTTSTTTSTTDTTTDTTSDSPFDSGDFGSDSGMSHSAPSFTNNIDLGDEKDEPKDKGSEITKNLPKGKVLNLIFNDDKPEELKVKVLNTDTGEIELKDISEINI